MPNAPWKYICGDFFGPLPSGEELLVIVDYFSRFMITKIMKSTKAVDVIHAFGEIFSTFGFPEKCLLDNGPPFNSKELEKYCEQCGIKIIHSSPYYPQGNGLVERENRNIKRVLTNKDWKQALNDYVLVQHTTPHSTTGVPPAELLFGRNLEDKLPGFVKENEYQYEGTVEEDALMMEKGKVYTDSRRNTKKRSLKVGETVMMKNNNEKKKFDSNFDKRCLELVDKEGNEVWLKDPKGKLYKRNISHVQRFDGIAPNLVEESEELFDDEVEECPVPEVVGRPRDLVQNLDIPTHKSKSNYTHIPTQI